MLRKLKLIRNDTPAMDESVAEKAARLFDSGRNCAQAVLEAVTGVDDPQLQEIAKSFGAGIGGAKCLCGAVSGGVMALSLQGKGKQSKQLVEAFRRRNRLTCCAGLSKPYRWKSKEHRDNCRRLTAETAEMVRNLLQGEAAWSGGDD